MFRQRFFYKKRKEIGLYVRKEFCRGVTAFYAKQEAIICVKTWINQLLTNWKDFPAKKSAC